MGKQHLKAVMVAKESQKCSVEMIPYKNLLGLTITDLDYEEHVGIQFGDPERVLDFTNDLLKTCLEVWPENSRVQECLKLLEKKESNHANSEQ